MSETNDPSAAAPTPAPQAAPPDPAPAPTEPVAWFQRSDDSIAQQPAPIITKHG